MLTRPAALAVASLLSLACGEGSTVPGRAEGTEPITGGAFDGGDPAVVLLVAEATYGTDTQSWFCTGTLIAPSTVLTAAHCTELAADTFHARAFFTSRWDVDAQQVVCTSPACSVVEVSEQFPHPFATPDNYTSGYDVALLRLAAPVTDRPWIPISGASMEPDLLLRQARHVGFGLTQADGDPTGEKVQAYIPIREILPRLFQSSGYGRSICSGDSGGPVLLAMDGLPYERVIGVASYGDVNCNAGWSVRVDAMEEFVTSTMAGWEPSPTCALDGHCVAAGCAAADPDCRVYLEACTSDAACAEGVCWGDPQHRGAYCSRMCAGAAECAGLACGASGRCELPQAPVAQLGQPCTAADFCADFGVCEGETISDLRCRLPCEPGAVVPGCPRSDQTCLAGAGGSGFCKDAPAPPPRPKDEGGCGAGAGVWALLALPLLAARRPTAPPGRPPARRRAGPPRRRRARPPGSRSPPRCARCAARARPAG